MLGNWIMVTLLMTTPKDFPLECTKMKIIELGKPFGKIVNKKVNVGANHNQRFVEFASVSLLVDSLFVCIILSLPWI